MTSRDLGIMLAVTAAIAFVLALVVAATDPGELAFWIEATVAVAIAVIIGSELTGHGEPRRFRPLRGRPPHESQGR
jgi:hypothetical protein